MSACTTKTEWIYSDPLCPFPTAMMIVDVDGIPVGIGNDEDEDS